jgi:hypothetical protein
MQVEEGRLDKSGLQNLNKTDIATHAAAAWAACTPTACNNLAYNV